MARQTPMQADNSGIGTTLLESGSGYCGCCKYDCHEHMNYFPSEESLEEAMHDAEELRYQEGR